MKRARQDRTTAEKIEILDRFKEMPATISQREAMKRLGVTRGFLRNLLKNEAAIRTEDHAPKTAKRRRLGRYGDVDQALHIWLMFARSINVPVNGPILRQKANSIAAAAGHDGFKATDGWFTRWKKRYGVVLTTQRGEAAEANVSGAEELRKTVMVDLLKKYSPENIYNADNPAPIDDNDSESDVESREPTPPPSEIRHCLHRLGVALERMGSGSIGEFYAMKSQVTEELRQKYPPKQETIETFMKLFC